MPNPRQPHIELLEGPAALAKWGVFGPILEAASTAHPIVASEVDADHFYQQVATGQCAVFDCTVDGETTLVLVIQFAYCGRNKTAEIAAVAGKHLMFFKHLYWEPILEWLKANDVVFVDAHVPLDRVDLYRKRFGFKHACAYIRLQLR
jgi:hypothetical protein